VLLLAVMLFLGTDSVSGNASYRGLTRLSGCVNRALLPSCLKERHNGGDRLGWAGSIPGSPMTPRCSARLWPPRPVSAARVFARRDESSAMAQVTEIDCAAVQLATFYW
jgi:hypothetical protein